MAVTRDGVVYNVHAPEDLNTAATNCRNTEDRVAAMLSELKTYVQGLEASWQGIAHAQFEILMQEWDANAALLRHALLGIAGGLDGSSHNIVDAEAAAVAQVSSINLPPANLGL
ncbi:WXG100 family type VII secretion target [Streptomyces sp. NPDC005122]